MTTTDNNKARHLALAAYLYWRAADYDEAGMPGYAERARQSARRHRQLGR